MKVSIRKLKTGFLYTILIMSFANASLRLNASGFSTLYRLVSPIPVIMIIMSDRNRLKKTLFVFLSWIVYSLIVSVFYHNISINYHVNLIYLMVLYIIVDKIRFINNDFDTSFFSFLDTVTNILLVLAFLQMIVHEAYPYVRISPKRTIVNLFFTNENEFAEPLSCIAIIYMVQQFVKKERKYLIRTLVIFIIVYLNDAKFCLLGLLFGALLTTAYMDTSRKKNKHRGGNRRLIIGVIVTLIIILVLSMGNFTLKFQGYNISFNDLITKNVAKIINGEAYSSGGGSIIDRTNAIIYGLGELKNTYLFGIGFGNSVYMLSMPQYTLLSAQSMHNIFFQLICEFGYVAMIGYFLLGKKVIQGIREDANWMNVLKLIYFLSFILISSQSSVGILSNYMTWTITFYIALLGNKGVQSKRLYDLRVFT